MSDGLNPRYEQRFGSEGTWTDGGYHRRYLRLYWRYLRGDLDYKRLRRYAWALESRCKSVCVKP